MRQTGILAFAAVLALGASAAAADLPVKFPPMPVIQDVPSGNSGWYLRGDFGYRFNQAGTATSLLPPDPVNSRIDDVFAFGLGAGYKWSWFRADLTFDYAFPADYRGDTPGFTPDFSAKVQSSTVLGNLYLDLGTWSGLTPYVGGGAGTAYLRVTDFASASLPASPVSADRWNFAWAAIAGVSYRFTPNLLADIGYRYLDQGQAVTGLSGAGDQLILKNLTSHELRAGMRWML